MNILTFKKSISTMVMVAYTTLTSLIPMGQVSAAPLCSASNPTTASGGTPGCAVKQFSGVPFAYAKFAWQEVGSLDQSPTSGLSLTMASGDRVTASNNRTAAALGLKANQVADVMSLFPTGVPFVFARYNQMSHELRVDVFKVEKSGSQMKMLQAPFTPAHGGAFAASMTYSTKADRALGANPGPDPFAPYNHPGQDAFYGVVGLDVVQTVTGNAMRMAGASIGLVAVSETRPNQFQTTSGGWLKKTVTTHVEGWTKPLWFVATPSEFQPQGTDAGVCMVPPDVNGCPAASFIPSGVKMTQWTGGSLPAFETMTSDWTKSQSSYTVLAFVVVAFLVVMTAGALAVAAGASAGALGPATLIQGLFSVAPAAASGTAMTMNAVLASAAIESAAVAGVSALSGAGLTDGTRFFYQGARDGFGEPVIPTAGSPGASMYDGLQAKFDNAPLSAMGVQAVSQGLYGVNCAPGAKSTECANSGVVPRTDTGVESNNVKFWKDNGGPVLITSPFLQK